MLRWKDVLTFAKYGNPEPARRVEHSAAEWARLLPAFVDRTSFIRAAGLTNTRASYAVVLNQRGEVLARAEGHFDADKAQALRETLAGIDQF